MSRFAGRCIGFLERCVGKGLANGHEDAKLLSKDVNRPDTDTKETEEPIYFAENKSSTTLDDSAYFSSDDLKPHFVDLDVLDSGNQHVTDEPSDEVLLGTYLWRNTSIQDRSMRITRRRHQKVALKKKRGNKAENPGKNGSCSREECSTSEEDADEIQRENTSPGQNERNIVSRATSVQIRSWEIRKKRKQLLNQRKSKCYDNQVVEISCEDRVSP